MTARPAFGNRRGQAAVEFTLAFVIFIVFMIVLSDMVRICHRWVSLQYAVNEAARYGSLGSTGPGGRDAAIEQKVVDIADSLGVHGVVVTFLDDAGSASPGAPLTFYRLVAQTPVILNPLSSYVMAVTGDISGEYQVTAEAVIRNEPFA